MGKGPAHVDLVSTGHEALACGAWEQARGAFERALAIEETPELLEGLSWAAWWLDDAGTVFDARERAHRRYRNDGKPAAAARMATWLAVDELDFNGAEAVASGWLERARRLLEPLEPGPDHGWFAFFEGYIAHGEGDAAKATELAGQAARLGRRFGVADLEMLGLALEGGALVACARVDEGMRCLDEATATALSSEAEIPISTAWTCCFLVTACTAVRDFERAFEWCDRIAEFAEHYGSRYMLAFCRAEYGAVHLWRGRWSEAEQMLEASVEDYAQTRPAWVGAPILGLAELRGLQGRPQEALRLLDEVEPGSATQLCRARLALDQGNALGAAEGIERLLRQLPTDRRVAREPALELLIRARVASGELDQARSALEEFREIERLVGTAPLRACGDLAEGMLRAAEGDHAHARALFEDAVDLFEANGGLFAAAEARLELATTLIALGRPTDGEREAGAARERLLELGAQAQAQRAQRVIESCSPDDDSSPLSELTPREREVLGLLAEGLTNRQIAERLVVSEHTVHRHVTNILRKLELPSRTAAAALAVRTGLLAAPGR